LVELYLRSELHRKWKDGNGDRVVLFAGGLAGVNVGDTWELKIESIPK